MDCKGKIFNEKPITAIAATVCEILGVNPPLKAAAADAELLAYAKSKLSKAEKIDRVLIYNPDAIAEWLTISYPNIFQNILKHAPHAEHMLSMIPPKTPVCFASMYTGLLPSEHGIQKYIKLRLEVESMFDALIADGKKACIVTVANQSMDILFRGKAMDYYALDSDAEVTKKAASLIEEDKYDVICVYNQEYDDRMHRSHPKSKSSVLALRHYAENFDTLGQAVDKHWKKHKTLIGCCTDHGVHREWYLLGQHGKNIAKDMNIIHWWGIKG